MEVTQPTTHNLTVNAQNLEPVTPSGIDQSPMTMTPSAAAEIHLGQEYTPDPKLDEADAFDNDQHGEGEKEEEDDEELFEGSTHGFLIYFHDTHSYSKLIVSIFVIGVQLVLYSVILNGALKGISGDDFTVDVKVRFGRSCEKLENLICPPELPNLGYTTLAGCILAFFLMHDMIAGIRIILIRPGILAKVGGVIVIIEALMAALCGTLFALTANEGYDAIANCIGVLFIHDVDEKAYEAFKAIKFDKICKCKKKCTSKLIAPHSIIFVSMFGVLVFSMSLAGVVRQLQLDNIREEYGDKFTDKFFDDYSSGYTYDWGHDSDYNWWEHAYASYYGGDSYADSNRGGFYYDYDTTAPPEGFGGYDSNGYGQTGQYDNNAPPNYGSDGI